VVNFDETDGQNGSGVPAALVVTCHQRSTKHRGADE
jgi:hypothetical protein